MQTTYGDLNIAIGYHAGDNITSGDGNVVIGNTDVASATGDNQLSISSGQVGGTAWITGDSSGNVSVTSNLNLSGSNKELRFYEGANYVGFEAPALSADKIWVLPAADGSANQVLKTDGSGNLGFATPAGGGTNTPAFLAYRSGSAMSIPDDTYTKFIFNAEKYDTASAYNISDGLFTVPSGQDGKYVLGGMLYMGGASASRFILRMRLNNSTTLIFMDGEKTAPCTAFASTVVSLSVGDTVQIDAVQNSGSAQNYDNNTTAEANYFFGYKIIE